MPFNLFYIQKQNHILFVVEIVLFHEKQKKTKEKFLLQIVIQFQCNKFTFYSYEDDDLKRKKV